MQPSQHWATGEVTLEVTDTTGAHDGTFLELQKGDLRGPEVGEVDGGPVAPIAADYDQLL